MYGGNNCLFISPHNQSLSTSLRTTEAYSLASFIAISESKHRGRWWLLCDRRGGKQGNGKMKQQVVLVDIASAPPKHRTVSTIVQIT